LIAQKVSQLLTNLQVRGRKRVPAVGFVLQIIFGYLQKSKFFKLIYKILHSFVLHQDREKMSINIKWTTQTQWLMSQTQSIVFLLPKLVG
jgi:hypothetical protein